MSAYTRWADTLVETRDTVDPSLATMRALAEGSPAAVVPQAYARWADTVDATRDVVAPDRATLDVLSAAEIDTVNCWVSGSHDPGAAAYISACYTSSRHMVHTSFPGDPTKHYAERFICPNEGKTLHDDLRADERAGRASHICLDMHHGPGHTFGRADGHWPSPMLTKHPDGNPVMYQHYWTGSHWQYWLHEGGVRPAIEAVFRWIPNYPSIKTFALFNEPKHVDWLVDHTRNNGWYDLAASKCAKAGITFVGYWGGGGWTELSREYCQGIDVHGIQSRNGGAKRNATTAANQSGLPVYFFELTAAEPSETEKELRLLLQEKRVVAVGGFAGDTKHFPSRNVVPWNGRNHKTFVANWNG